MPEHKWRNFGFAFQNLHSLWQHFFTSTFDVPSLQDRIDTGLALQVLEHNNAVQDTEQRINLKGILVGNGVTGDGSIPSDIDLHNDVVSATALCCAALLFFMFRAGRLRIPRQLWLLSIVVRFAGVLFRSRSLQRLAARCDCPSSRRAGDQVVC